MCIRDRYKDYRLYVISRIPSLRVLDFSKVKQKERDEAKKKYGDWLANKKLMESKGLDRREKIKLAIENATTMEEVNRLELLLKSSELSEAIFDQKLNEIKGGTLFK
eukprot:TRINITY_DN1000_c0_g1_i15.p2 TRINITY_DN1000_c0_g1~~TRINITY_DN1000_c0_g1_i15.p2  ORF type:complete len:107 (-),score=40.14 TRINITY_DN1000_c0_g1_i15:256-576(-)